mgnify:FL=1
MSTATTMPNAEIWLPLRAVFGEFMKCRPTTKQDGREQVDEPSDDVDGANGCGGHYFDSPFFSFLLD